MTATTAEIGWRWPEIDGTEGALAMFTVYAFPTDYPAHWVVRRMFVLPSGQERLDVVPRLAVDLESARALVPPYLYRDGRYPGDDPHIIEVWY
jgi:hypothetical protein